MKRLRVLVFVSCVLLVSCHGGQKSQANSEKGWISLFDGESLAGWKASENKDTFSVKDGMIVVKGPRSHLFYAGPVENANFTDFEFKAEVKTETGSNSGIYFHTEYQETDWPAKGYEVQVNNTHSDRKKTGGLYAVEDVLDNSPAKDDEWFTEHIIVQGKRIIIKVDGETTVDWTEPPGYVHPQFPGRKISSGTFALQGHDPDSVVYFRNIMVRPLPSRAPVKAVVVTGGHDYEEKPFNEMFESFEGIKCTQHRLKDDSEIFEDISKWDYDVIVLYNMTQKISPKRQENFKALLRRGVGLVVLHHAMGSFYEWPAYRKIAGGWYRLKDEEYGGERYAASTYKHDVDIKVRIQNTRHPITQGMKDFEIHDETYKGCGFVRSNRVLLTTEHPTSDKAIGWVRRYAKARVCTIQLGHGSEAYNNPNYRRLVSRAIKWTAWRLKKSAGTAEGGN